MCTRGWQYASTTEISQTQLRNGNRVIRHLSALSCSQPWALQWCLWGSEFHLQAPELD